MSIGSITSPRIIHDLPKTVRWLLWKNSSEPSTKRERGFVIMTLLYLFLQILVLTESDKWNYKKFLVIDLVFTFAVFVIFRYGFKMMLPTGDFVNMLGRLV